MPAAVTILALLLILLGLACAWFFRFAHCRTDNTEDILNSDIRIAYRNMVDRGLAYIQRCPQEIVKVTSSDGLRLQGVFLPTEHPRATILCFHGYRSVGMQDFAPMPEFYHSLGLNVLIVDQRASGKSEGKYITFGILERQDVVTWAEFMDKKLHGTPLLLDGISLGASTVMMAADLPLPDSVKGILADCGFTSPWDIITHCGRKWFHLPPFPLVHILSLVSRIKFGCSYHECSTLRSLANTRLPILLLHGADDDFVPTYMSEENYEAAASYKQKLIIPGAGHGMSYLIDRDACQRELRTFIDHILE